jgi:alanyl-tRNA synthetase
VEPVPTNKDFAMMTSFEIRQSFLDFFKSKSHTIVPSSSLMPDSPNLLFTNAGMNQFVPIFLGQKNPDVKSWAGVIPGKDTRAADTQKCIRAGGKHNDLDDVGLDTYHHTFFEMLGNWSFGDYFKKEAIDWAWELVIKGWGFPADRVYATVFCPYLGEPGWEAKWRMELEQVLVLAMTSPEFIPPSANASPFEIADQEAAMYWAKKFQTVGCDPKVHIIPGNRKDNFWMMGETGPCGPCSELHVDLTPEGNTRGALVNKGDARCIEIWNLVFIQFNANPDGSFVPLPAKHVDTGMGFERVTSIIQGTNGLKDFANAKISNYETDIFRPIFDALEKLSGKKYGSTLPLSNRVEVQAPATDQAVLNDLAVIATSWIARGITLDVWSAEMVKEYGDPVKPLLASAWAVGNARLDTEAQKVADALVAQTDWVDGQQVSIDIAFRVIADHIRTLSFAIADGIQPGNTDRNYVLRRILRRAVRYGRTLGFHEPFFYKLVDVLAETMGDIFPEIRAKRKHVQDVIRVEEEAFNKTLDRGIKLFENEVFANAITLAANKEGIVSPWFSRDYGYLGLNSELPKELELAVMEFTTLQGRELGKATLKDLRSGAWSRFFSGQPCVLGKDAFELYDTYGFPLDLTELMARERGLTVDKEGFEKLMEEQRNRARAAQKKEVISVSQVETTTPTKFVGFDTLETDAKVVEVVSLKDKTAVILDTSACYAEMGGQVGDTGELHLYAADVNAESASTPRRLRITNTQKSGNTWLHVVEGENLPAPGDGVVLRVDAPRRNAIQRHHTVTHLLHWALHEVVSKEASQKGSFVGPDKLTFDFNSAPLTPAQVADIEKLVNERVVENAGVSWTEVAYADVKSRKDVMQFFGDKYGDTVRVVQVGGRAGELNGYSMELCGGTHTRATGEIGLFRIVGESAIAAGVRRIEAVAGLTAYDVMKLDRELIKTVAGKVNSPIHELDKKIEALLAQQKALEKEVQIALQRNASNAASELLERHQTVNGIPFISHNLGDANADFLQATADALKGRFKGVVVLGGCGNNAVTLVATVSPDFTAKVQAGKIIQAIAPIVGGKGGGKPDNARGGGKDAGKLDEALAKAKSLLG